MKRFPTLLYFLVVLLIPAAASAVPIPLVWLRADNVNGDNTNPVNGAPVSTWMDTSGNGNHFSQGTGNFQPIYQANSGPGNITQMPVIVFDGLDDSLRKAGGISHGDTTIFVVGKVPTGAGIVFGDWGGLPSRVIYNNSPVGSWRHWARDTAGATVQVISPETPNYQMNVSWIDANTMHYRQQIGTDPITEGSGAVNPAYTPAIWSATTFGTSLGAEDNGFGRDAFANLYVAEFIMYDGTLSVADRLEVENYLIGKYFEQVPEPSAIVLIMFGSLALISRISGRFMSS